jgi:hypothetical protein
MKVMETGNGYIIILFAGTSLSTDGDDHTVVRIMWSDASKQRIDVCV